MPHWNASEKAEWRTELPRPGDKDRICSVKTPEGNPPKKAISGGGDSGQNPILYQTITCGEVRRAGEPPQTCPGRNDIQDERENMQF